jgi:hypothetical protein
MNKRRQILYLLSLLLVLLQHRLQAQEQIIKPLHYGFQIYTGFTFSHNDIKPSKTTPVMGIGLNYAAMDYLDIRLSVDVGQIKGGISVADEPHFKNNYYDFCLTLRFYPLAVIDNSKDKDPVLGFISKLYLGTGIGYLHSNTITNKTPKIREWNPLGSYRGSDLFVPLEAGISVPFLKIKQRPRLTFNLNYCVNMTFSDEVDGHVPTVEANRFRDAYSVLSMGFGLRF